MAGQARQVTEVLAECEVPLWVHPEWSERFPWLVQGTTGRGREEEPFDLGLSGAQPVGQALDRWRRLRAASGLDVVAHSRQVHAADLWIHREVGAPGIQVMDGFDGHITDRRGLLVTVGVADCVPVSVIDPGTSVVAMLHAGWRGTAAGIVERAIHRMVESWQAAPERMHVHCGPAICGECYEVGPEVHEAVNPGSPVPEGRANIDVRASIARRVVELGVPAENVTMSTHCTRCGEPDFFSHRGGFKARQMGVLGMVERR